MIMIPLADMHCHLLAGLDDGPRTSGEALEMCRLAYAEGTRMVAALAHQNPRYRGNSPDRIREAAAELAKQLHVAHIPLSVYPSAEVMVHPGIEASWRDGQLLSIGDRRQYLLLEMPHNLCVDLRRIARALRSQGMRVILAHPEREEELLHDPGRIEELIRCGCIVQVSSESITAPRARRDAVALKSWARRGVIHLLGSDGHRPVKRPPSMLDAYQRLVRWTGIGMADRICSTHGMAILQGLPLRLPEVRKRNVSWFASLWS
jgi:protein-tyrosine phosphatase